ncbi:chromosome segregation DNA-binding protein [Poseidonocella pacifica]|uniref:Chromosome segregation DNA-binding protein n=1 Tax=Poseidonocella pacifica TaxID=871651 RepID=A0A1I0XUF5_9RHOB|nr:ParB/RepB/Spo0J family partition protein [Poseidonocella pacifica]SFB04769.1 chromosome segregation DNA-binding protein [Poseidonocella pacifica]
MSSESRSKGLGRGLSALLADIQPEQDERLDRAYTKFVPIEEVEPNPDQPRKAFSDADLDDLANSIAEKGILQPLIVRPVNGGERYQIVAGERRWRAAQMARLHEIPVLVRELNDVEVLEIAIVENVQRADLNAIEEATGYKQLIDSFGHTQEKIATALGKSRSHIANVLRLLNLPPEIQAYVSRGLISAGHARAVIGHERAVELIEEAVKKGLSVREIEKLAKKTETPSKATRRSARSGSKDPSTIELESDLSAAVGMKIGIDHDEERGSGRVSISYDTLDQLDDICRLLGQSTSRD